MSLRLRLAIEGRLPEYLEARRTALFKFTHAGAKEISDDLKGRLRQDVVNAGLGQRTANTWRGAVYPRKPVTLTPAAAVYSNAAHIVRAFEEGVTIRSNDGFWLAIPTDEVPQSMRRGTRNRPRISPGEMERRLGQRLRFVPAVKGTGRAGKMAYLVADNMRRRKGKRGGFAAASETAKRKGQAESIVLFILVPQVRLRKRLHVASIEAAMRASAPATMQAAIDRGVTETNREFDVPEGAS